MPEAVGTKRCDKEGSPDEEGAKIQEKMDSSKAAEG